MHHSTPTKILSAAVIALSLCGCGSEPKKAEPATGAKQPMTDAAAPVEKPLTTQESKLVTVTATVQAIDIAKREVTLKSADGDTVTFTVDPSVKRLNEVSVGDKVTAQYYVAVLGELRSPTEEEKAHPYVVLDAAGRATKDAPPAAGAVRIIKLVTTVQNLDLAMQTVTLRGPRGNPVTIRAKNPDNLRKLKLGDTIVVTYTESLAISLEKASQ